MADQRLLALATDPSLVPGIYNGCDQWCQYCPATARCLAFRGRQERERAGVRDRIEDIMFESMRYLRACHEAEGLQPPADMLQMLSGEPPRGAQAPADAPLERMGKQYAAIATVFLATRAEPLPRLPLPARADGPLPFEVFLFYHVLIAIKIYRAMSSAGEAASTGSAQALWDANVSAKVALLGVDRSDEALLVMGLDDDDPRIAHMRAHLSRLRRAIEARFPAARILVRPGLDDAYPDRST